MKAHALALVLVICLVSIASGQYIETITHDGLDGYELNEHLDWTQDLSASYAFNPNNIDPYNIDWTAATDALYTTNSGRFDGGVGIGVAPSARLLKIYKSTATLGVGLEIDNLGQADAIVRFALDGVSKFTLGVDNSVAGDPFKISVGNILGTNDALTLDSSGDFVIPGDISGGTFSGATISTGISSLTIDDVTNSNSWESYGGDAGITNVADGFTLWGGTIQRDLTVTGGDWTIDKDVSGLLGATPGTASASLALIVDANKDIDLDGGDITTTGNFYTGGALYHTGDVDTYISFFEDGYLFYAGGLNFTRVVKNVFGDNQIYINYNGDNINFIVEGDTDESLLFTDASTDRVGIGTATPAQKLDINGITLTRNKLAFTQTDLNEYIDSLADGYMDYGATTGHRFNAPVGIGTTAPDSIFHIKANVAGEVGSHPAGQLIIQDPDDTVFGNAVITGYESDGAGNPDQQLWYLGSSSSGNSNIIFLNRRNSKLQLGTNDVSRLTILGNGNVGIGETSPQDKLEVNGTILVKDKLKFTQDDGNEYIDSLNDGYLDLAATTGIRANANFDITGTIRTTADQDWNLGAAGAGAPTPDSKIRVTIGGVDYDISAEAIS